MVAAAAIKYNNRVWTGLRHNLVRDAIYSELGTDIRLDFVRNSEQGFVDTYGNFLNRQQARELALQSGQVREEDLQTRDELFSEDLW